MDEGNQDTTYGEDLLHLLRAGQEACSGKVCHPAAHVQIEVVF